MDEKIKAMTDESIASIDALSIDELEKEFRAFGIDVVRKQDELAETVQPQQTRLEILLDSHALKSVYTGILNGDLTYDEFVKVFYVLTESKYNILGN